ncbi:mfs multidrug transporter [Apiospora arundinis]
MASLVCCGSIAPYRPQYLLHQTKFDTFIAWASYPKAATPSNNSDEKPDLGGDSKLFAIQLVQQVNYGPLESKRYFVPKADQPTEFVEITEDDLVQANYKKLNAYKNYKCEAHNKFFELNVYQKDPVNKHHWRANLARPAGSIDL